MFRVPSISGLFKWRQFEPEVILLAVGWYLRFSLSYRNVEELLAERGLHADHVTVWRWVLSVEVWNDGSLAYKITRICPSTLNTATGCSAGPVNTLQLPMANSNAYLR
jgi:hypothetical protein